MRAKSARNDTWRNGLCSQSPAPRSACHRSLPVPHPTLVASQCLCTAPIPCLCSLPNASAIPIRHGSRCQGRFRGQLPIREGVGGERPSVFTTFLCRFETNLYLWEQFLDEQSHIRMPPTASRTEGGPRGMTGGAWRSAAHSPRACLGLPVPRRTYIGGLRVAYSPCSGRPTHVARGDTTQTGAVDGIASVRNGHPATYGPGLQGPWYGGGGGLAQTPTPPPPGEARSLPRCFHTTVGLVKMGRPSSPMTVPAPIDVRERQ